MGGCRRWEFFSSLDGLSAASRTVGRGCEPHGQIERHCFLCCAVFASSRIPILYLRSLFLLFTCLNGPCYKNHRLKYHYAGSRFLSFKLLGIPAYPEDVISMSEATSVGHMGCVKDSRQAAVLSLLSSFTVPEPVSSGVRTRS